ncbi:uncharacterized protein PAC_01607 [Phialocephala subalpina]|uniref:Uncharacterized protein n=1 Tax=Phialocephala subalpina TaxID=576137 RepID=A0A1L7WG36_9HELO|nr:uncharacterized protein PAC_01607 [Phialocephala subalpina]
MAIETIGRLEQELVVVEAKLIVTKETVKQIDADRDECKRQHKEATKEVKEFRRQRLNAKARVTRAQKTLATAQEDVKNAEEKIVHWENEVERLKAERKKLSGENEFERLCKKLGKKLRGVMNELKKLREQDLNDWASWPADELVRRWENGDIYYEVFEDRKNGNVKKLRDAYLKCNPHGAPVAAVLWIISTEILDKSSECSTPWESTDWDPDYAAFPKPEEVTHEEGSDEEVTNGEASDEEDSDEEVTDEESENEEIEDEEDPDEEDRNEEPINDSVDDEETADMTTSFTATQTSTISNDADCGSPGSVLGKRTRQSYTANSLATTTSPSESSCSHADANVKDEPDIKTEMKEEEIKPDIDIVMKTEVKENDTAIKTEAEAKKQEDMDTKTDVDTVMTTEIEEQDISDPKTEGQLKQQGDVVTDANIDTVMATEVEENHVATINEDVIGQQRAIKQEVDETDMVMSGAETDVEKEKNKESSSMSMLTLPGSYPASKLDTEERPAKRERLNNPGETGTFNSNVLSSYFSFDTLPKLGSPTPERGQPLESSKSDSGRELGSPTSEPTLEELQRLDSRLPELLELDLDLEYAAAEQYLDFDD